VLTPAFVPGLTISADYYNIRIDNVISAVASQDILNGCYDAPNLDNQFCDLISPRNADGTFQTPALLESTLNYAAKRAKGLDIDVSYNHRFSADDRIGLRLQGSWVQQRNDYPYLDTPEIPDRLKGELGTPIYRANFEADWTHRNVTLSYTLRFVGRQSLADWELQHATDGVPDSPYDPLYADVVYYPKRIYHDINIEVKVGEHFSLYGGVNNLTDKLPPYGLLGLGGGGVDGTGNDALYDNIGRFMYAGVRVKL
jgi:outer membrane receptor protein involved in Fe transport